MKFFFSFFCLAFIGTACASQGPLPETVDYVDPIKYMGRWYEIGRFPNSFQDDCLASRATYTLKRNGKIKVLNECQRIGRRNSKGKAIAIIKDKKTNAKLKVSFVPFFKHFGLFGGDYWILALDQNYSRALVGDSKRKYLWILSRTKRLEEKYIQELLQVAEQQDFNIQKFKKSPIWKD